jgi:hypothetical protein
MEIPDVTEIGWYRHGAAPGRPGSTVLVATSGGAIRPAPSTASVRSNRVPSSKWEAKTVPSTPTWSSNEPCTTRTPYRMSCGARVAPRRSL